MGFCAIEIKDFATAAMAFSRTVSFDPEVRMHMRAIFHLQCSGCACSSWLCSHIPALLPLSSKIVFLLPFL